MTGNVYEPISKALLVAGMLPLDAKGWFQTLADMRDLGTTNARAFTYYDMMNAACVENQLEYQWKEVQPTYQGGVLVQNFQYPPNTVAQGIDYSMKYYNFVPRNTGSTVGSEGVLVVGSYIIFKGYTGGVRNTSEFLQINDLVMGFFSESIFMTAKYLGGSIVDIMSWAVINQSNPTVHNTPGQL